MLTTRFATSVIVLLVVAAVPTVLHSYLDTTIVDGRSARSVPMTLAGETGVQTSRRENWGDDRLGSRDWTERRYPTFPEVKLFIGRSYDPKRLYHHPELAVDYGQAYGASSIIHLPARPDVPIHFLRGDDSTPTRIAIYALRHRESYIDDPIRFQLRTSFALLFSRRAAMTLFFAAQELGPDQPVETSRAAALLIASMDAFEKQ
jgi:hypothetical protein